MKNADVVWLQLCTW